MRQMANSQAYQLSSRYSGEWNPAWEKLYARKLVRRLWAEEIHDSIAMASNILPTYNINMPSGWTVRYAMQLPEPRGLPGGAAGVFLDSFLRGNREDDDRRSEGSPSQALSLMNDSFVMSRTKSSGSGATASLLAKYLNTNDETLVVESLPHGAFAQSDGCGKKCSFSEPEDRRSLSEGREPVVVALQQG